MYFLFHTSTDLLCLSTLNYYHYCIWLGYCIVFQSFIFSMGGWGLHKACITLGFRSYEDDIYSSNSNNIRLDDQTHRDSGH